MAGPRGPVVLRPPAIRGLPRRRRIRALRAAADAVLVDGIPIRMGAVPVRYENKVIAVVTKEGSPATSRRPGRLEQVYLDAAEHFSRMIADGTYPYPGMPRGDWPRVGDGLFRFD